MSMDTEDAAFVDELIVLFRKHGRCVMVDYNGALFVDDLDDGFESAESALKGIRKELESGAFKGLRRIFHHEDIRRIFHREDMVGDPVTPPSVDSER
jgi:hypothetical protein